MKVKMLIHGLLTVTIPEDRFANNIGCNFSGFVVGLSINGSEVSLVCTSLVFNAALVLDSFFNSYAQVIGLRTKHDTE